MASPQNGDDGQPTAADEDSILSPAAIFAMKSRGVSMPAQVILQACDTSALSDASSGEWLTVAPAFIASGSREVITTLYPVPDVSGVDDPIIRAALDGVGLAQAVQQLQREGLTRWISGLATQTSQTPLAWSAYATVSVGSKSQLSETDQPEQGSRPSVLSTSMDLVSDRMFEVLARAIKECREGRRKNLDTGYFLSACLDEYELAEFFDGAGTKLSPSAFLWKAGPYTCSRLLGFNDGTSSLVELESGVGIQVPRLLIDSLSEATQAASHDGVAMQPEHLMLSILARPSAASRILKLLSRLSRRPTVLTLRAFEHLLAEEVCRGQVAGPEHEPAANENLQLAHAVIERARTAVGSSVVGTRPNEPKP